MKPIIVRRWEVALSFVFLTVAFVGVSAWLTSVARSAHRAASAAQVDAIRIGYDDRRIIRLRNEQVRILCHAERDSAIALRRILRLAQRLSASERGQTPSQRRTSVSFYARARSLTRPLDCAKLTRKTPKATP